MTEEKNVGEGGEEKGKGGGKRKETGAASDNKPIEFASEFHDEDFDEGMSSSSSSVPPLLSHSSSSYVISLASSDLKDSLRETLGTSNIEQSDDLLDFDSTFPSSSPPFPFSFFSFSFSFSFRSFILV